MLIRMECGNFYQLHIIKGYNIPCLIMRIIGLSKIEAVLRMEWF